MSKLWWYRQHQNNFRRTAEETLRRFNRNRKDGHVGRAIILPSGFPGGERYRQRQYLDAMAVVARFGKPDLFITFTCNPKWSEIRDNLLVHQRWEDRPDLICRVFQMKLLDFMHDVIHGQIYGVVHNYHYVIEFQKRGLPHAHIVLTFYEDDKLREIDSLDKVISACIPDKEKQPLLYGRVGEFQLHAPCGKMNMQASCMRDGQCTKFFPKPYREESVTSFGRQRRPDYRRPADGREIFVAKWNCAVNNRRVVPYNAYSIAKYQCYINFEAVGSLNTIQYLHKYITKRPDSTTIYVDVETSSNNPGRQRRIDEIQDYINGRYVSGIEATWKTFQFKMHNRSHSVLVLPVHLPGEREIMYTEEDDIEEVEGRLLKITKLEAWFNLNRTDPDAKLLKYVEIPEHYVWNDRSATWVKRSQISKMIGCIVEVSPSEGQMEKFFLRLLLKRIKGALSFDDLLKLEDGYVCETYREACQRRNWLIESGGEFERSLEEAESKYHPRKFRKLFALICCVAFEEDVAQIAHLWRRFRKSLIADYIYNGMRKSIAISAAIEDLKSILSRCRPGMSLTELGIETYDEEIDGDEMSETDEREGMINIHDDENFPLEMCDYSVSSLNKDQKIAFLRVLNAVSRICNLPIPIEIYEELGNDVTIEHITNRPRENVFYLDGPGGTGKTHLYNTLIEVINKVMCRKTIAVAWTGIAANILIGGTTVHRSFKLPLTLSEETTCGFDIESSQSKNIKENVALIIWDEAPMTPKLAVEAVNRYMMVIMRWAEAFGGKCVLFGGDFRQILPVVQGANQNDVIAQSLKASSLWPSFTLLKLMENMRTKLHPETALLYDDLGNRTFADWLLALGSGTLPYVTLNEKSAPIAPDDLINIPTRFQVSTMEDLIDFVYQGNFTSRENGSRAILCPTNAAVNEVNNKIIDRIVGETARTYLSTDTCVLTDDDDFVAPIDLLNSINIASLPPHELVLKRGAIVMLLRNLDVDEGECNGSRMRVISLGNHIIECELLTGQRVGERVILPRLKMRAQNTMLPRELQRHQFPIRVAYAMTINKSQGQTLKKVGICLKRPCFTHGQLYVAFSRVGDIHGVKIFIEDSAKQGTFKFRGRKRFTRNIVFSKVLEKGHDGRIHDRRSNDFIDDTDDGQLQDYDISDNEELLNELDDTIFENIQLNDIFSNVNLVVKDKEDNDDDDDVYWKGAVPFRTESQLRNRVSVYDRPGTSGRNFNDNVNTCNFANRDESESDIDMD